MRVIKLWNRFYRVRTILLMPNKVFVEMKRDEVYNNKSR